MNSYTIQDDVNRRAKQFLADTAANAARIGKAMVREGQTTRVAIYGRHIDNSAPLAHIQQYGSSVVIYKSELAPKSLR